MDGHRPRRAFLLGCNSESLAHCERDAQTLCSVLAERYGWCVDPCTSAELRALRDQGQGTPVGLVSQRLRTFLKGCAGGDTAVFYFSGHSLYRRDVFNLVIGDDVNDTDHLLDLQVVVSAFKQHPKPAAFLLILDCCDAGQAAADDRFWNGIAGTWGRIWVATRTNENALECDGATRGGLFTAAIHRALTAEARRLADAGCLRINRAHAYVSQCARDYQSPSRKAAPHPGLYGNMEHDILLAVDLGPNETAGFAPAALWALADLIRVGALEAGTLTRLYQEVRAAGGLSPANDYRGPVGFGEAVTLEQAIDHLAQAGYREHQTPQVPLAEFVARVAALAFNARDLHAWLRTALQAPAAGRDLDAFIASLALGHTATDQGRTLAQGYLAVALRPRDANAATEYSVEVRLVDPVGQGASIAAPASLLALADLPDLLRQALNDPAVLDAADTLDRPLTLEFFLPNRLLGRDPDDWTPRDGPPRRDPRDLPLGERCLERPLSERYIVTVRAQARVRRGADLANPGRSEPYEADWRRRWDQCEDWRRRSNPCADCRGPAGGRGAACCVRIDAPGTSYRSALRGGACLFVLGFTPDADGSQLDLLLCHGLSAILWSGEPLAPGAEAALIDEVVKTYPGEPAKRPTFADLPYALLLLRQRYWEQSECRHTGHLHLLWDDPHRRPFDVGRAAPGADPRPAAAAPRLRFPG